MWYWAIAIANHAYDIGEQVPSALMSLLALFVLWQYLPYIYRVLVKEENVIVPVYLFAWYEVKAVRTNDFYKLPNTPGLAGVSGIYEVSQFKRNGIEHPMILWIQAGGRM